MERLIWVSGFGYALTEAARSQQSEGRPGAYCLPEEGYYIGSKPLLEILNRRYHDENITSEEASRALMRGVLERFPCWSLRGRAESEG
jgi:hypothetical protein